MESLLVETTWVTFGFLIFIALIFKPVKQLILYALDKRADDIANQLEEAKALRQEAEAMLKDCKARQKSTMEEVRQILEDAEKEAARIIREGKLELEASCEKNMQMAVKRLAGYEATALSEVHSNAVDIAIFTVRSILRDRVAQGALSEDDIHKLFSDVSKHLN